MRRHRPEQRLNTELNVTNLLDTTLVLLLAFMIVTPTLQHGQNIDLPKVSGGESIESDTNKTLSITLLKAKFEGASEQVLVDGLDASDPNELRNKIRAKKAMIPTMDVIIESDKNVSYGRFMDVLAIVKEEGIENIGLPTEPIEDASLSK